jgi:sugar/nucleoside kinase (ribokinase family)
MIIILGDILADYSIRVETLDMQPRDLQRVTYLGLGPGGACNVAIVASRLGLDAHALGEVGQDLFGEIVLEGLADEGIDVSGMQVTPGTRTPVANVLVDERGEPAYLGFAGSLQMGDLRPDWIDIIRRADALYCDGWAEHPGVPRVNLEGLRVARPGSRPSSIPAPATRRSTTPGTTRRPPWPPSCSRLKMRRAGSPAKTTPLSRPRSCSPRVRSW